MPNSVRNEWESYRAAVMPAGAPLIEVFEFQRAFYAGGWAVFQLLQNSPDHFTDRELDDWLTGLRREMEAFTASVIQGRA